MSSVFDSPAIRYGMGLSSAAILTVVAFAFLDGTMRWLVLGLAVLEITVVPQILKRAG
ncbi:hypothetical protein HYG81_00885 [Natrinema zhouii]|uniref:Uncharacterized protein n=1 Tax=Natrinema zhouii TaxID=1710539 RepID=A0A7D6CRJ7_9EURY|nr:hypothetical protein [Natrinema zhouii]QLK26211.1 hypothetical protein HYG81_00885 [Natrinema zhouii]